MTKEEAIKVLNMVDEAKRIAIKALKQEPRKGEVILTKEEYGKLISSEFDNGYAKGYREALEQEPRWIPVSERLPEEGETVLVCYQTQSGVSQSVCEWFDMPNRGIVWSTLCGKKPIAWMPLPKPYKAESEVTDADSN